MCAAAVCFSPVVKLKVILFIFIDLPIAVSLPHFYNSDPTLLNYVDGLNPIKEKHESVVAMQPVSHMHALILLMNN